MVDKMKASKSVNTCRKTKIIGTQQYINRDTGEIIDCQVMEIEERDANFQKFWIGHILAAVDEIKRKNETCFLHHQEYGLLKQYTY